MIARPPSPRQTVRRLAVIGAVAGLHASLLALLLTGASHPVAAAAESAIMVREVAAVTPVAAPDFAPLPAIDADIAPPVIDVAAEAEGVACPLAGAIGAALEHDREVGAALAAQSGDVTSLMVWDGSWVTSASPAMLSIRRVVLDQIRRMGPSCRDAEMTGPRLFIVPNGIKNVAVAIGSGTWHWQQLLS